MATSLMLALAACGPDAQREPPSASSARPVTSQSAGAVASGLTSAMAAASSTEAERDAAKKRKLLAEAGIEEDLPDVDPSGAPLAPSDDNVAALLAGGPALTSLPVRSTDRGETFDRHLPARLKPPPIRRGPPPKCPPGDPLCDDL